MEIFWRDNFSCPTEDEYKQMVVRSMNDTIHYSIKKYNNIIFRNWWPFYVGYKINAAI